MKLAGIAACGTVWLAQLARPDAQAAYWLSTRCTASAVLALVLKPPVTGRAGLCQQCKSAQIARISTIKSRSNQSPMLVATPRCFEASTSQTQRPALGHVVCVLPRLLAKNKAVLC